MIKICCTSDLHGDFPKIPDCDLLIMAGDYNPHTRGQNWWMRDHFLPWLERVAERGIQIVGIAGNHDLIYEKAPELVPKLPWTYLQDSGCEKFGFKIWGTPWQPRFYDWAFNLDEPELAKKWALIPDDTDILIVHGPPRGCRDKTDDDRRIGSPSLLKRINAVMPKLVVCGHNHGGYGEGILKELATGRKTRVVNAAFMNEAYRPINPPIVVEL